MSSISGLCLQGEACVYVSSADNSHEKGQHTHGVAGLTVFRNVYLRPAFGLDLMVDRIEGRFFSSAAGAPRPPAWARSGWRRA